MSIDLRNKVVIKECLKSHLQSVLVLNATVISPLFHINNFISNFKEKSELSIENLCKQC